MSKTVQITITPPELSVKIARSVRVSKGTIAVGCVVLSPILRSCKVTVFVGRKKVGSATVRIRRRGKRSTTVKIKLNAQTLRKIAHSRRGIKVKLHLEVTEFGANTVFKTDAQTNVLAAKSSKKKH